MAKVKSPLSSVRILVVDDFAPWREQVRSILQMQPGLYVVAEAADGLEAVQKAQELKPDLILLDIGLLELNGIEAARRIRDLSPGSRIIIVSAENSPEVVQAALDAGAQGYVHKLDVRRDLLPSIEVVLRGKQFASSTLKSHKFTDTPAAQTPHRHEILLFSEETVLLDSFAPFIAAALKSDNAAIAVVTQPHRESLCRRLKADSVDIDGAIQQGTFVLLDVADTLATLLVDGSPDPVRFFEDFSRLIDTAAKAAKAGSPRVSFCGECIGTLWAEGETDAALRLEQVCNDLAETHDLDILCGYPLSGPRDKDEHLTSIYAEHSSVSR